MEHSRYDLNADKACHKRSHHDQAGGRVSETALLEVVFRGWQHAVKSHEQLCETSVSPKTRTTPETNVHRRIHVLTTERTYHYTEAQTERGRQKSIAVLHTKVLLAGKQSNDDVHVDDASTQDTSWRASHGQSRGLE